MYMSNQQRSGKVKPNCHYHCITHAQKNRYSSAATYALRTVILFVTKETKMSDLKVYNHVSENAKRDNLEQDLAEKLTRETPRTSSEGEY